MERSSRLSFTRLVFELRALLALLNGKQPSIPNSILPNSILPNSINHPGVNPNVNPYPPDALVLSHPSAASTRPARSHTLTPRHTLTHGELLPWDGSNDARISVFAFDVGETEDPWKISYQIELKILQDRETGERIFGPGLSSRELSRSRTEQRTEQPLRETPFPTLENLPRENQMTQMAQAPALTQPKSLLQQATETLLQKTAEETARSLGSHRLDSTAEGLATADSTTPDTTAEGLATEELSDSDSISEVLPTSSEILPAVRAAALQVLKQDEERSELLKEFLNPKRIAWWLSTDTVEDSVSDSARAGSIVEDSVSDSARVDSPSSVAERAFPDIAAKLLFELEIQNDYHNDQHHNDNDYHARAFSLWGISDEVEAPRVRHRRYMKGLFETTDTEKWFESWKRLTLRRQKEMHGTGNDELERADKLRLERLFLVHKEILKELGSPTGGVFIANDPDVPAFMFMLSELYLESQVDLESQVVWTDSQDSFLGRMARQGRQLLFFSKKHMDDLPSRNWDELPPEEMLLRFAARRLREARRLCLTEFFSQNVVGTDGHNLNPDQTLNAGTERNNAGTDNNNAGKVPPRECFLFEEEAEIHAKIVALWRQRHSGNDKILKVANVKFMSLEFLEQYEHGFFVASIMLRQIFDYALKRQQSLEEQETAVSKLERITYNKKRWEEYDKKMAAKPPLTREQIKSLERRRKKARHARVRKTLAERQRRAEAEANTVQKNSEEMKGIAERRLKKTEKAKEERKKKQKEQAKKFEDWRKDDGLKPEDRKRARETKVLLTGKERREIITALEEAEEAEDH